MKISRKGFTLVELLVVITIIAILAGLAFPAIQGALEAAKKAEATAMCTQLKTALSSYLNEYGVWPSTWGSGDSSDLETSQAATINPINLLLGEDDATNPRRIVFMEFDSDSLVNKQDPSRGVNDPWARGAAASPYYIRIDTNYDNKVTAPDPNGTVIRSSVIVWSNGKDDSDGTNGFNSAKDPKSW